MVQAKRALITGITGQDGAYLAEFLLRRGYEVHGIQRKASLANTSRLEELYEKLHAPASRIKLHCGDLSDGSSLVHVLQTVKPDEIYNLGAQSHVGISFEAPEYTANVNAMGTLRLLEAIRILGYESHVRFYQASTSELYGMVREVPQRESTPFYPRSPYGVSKLFSYWLTVNYRESYGIYGCNGILFNHESPYRGDTFASKKITKAVARISMGIDQCLYLGNLDSKRDWGHAKDYVRAQWLMLQQEKPKDYVIATGMQWSVRTFVEKTFEYVGITIAWEGEGLHEVARVTAVSSPDNKELEGKIVVAIDPRFLRPSEVDTLLGDPSLARKELGWEPEYTFESLIAEMVEYDLRQVRSTLYGETGEAKKVLV